MSDNLDGLTDEAVLHYRKLAKEEKKDPKRTPRPMLSGDGTPLVGAGVGAGAIVFAEQDLRADVTAAAPDDPWGSDDDEYALPRAVTRADDDRDRSTRRTTTGAALRSSGTRAGARPGQGGATVPPAMTTPGATVGGVGGPAVVSAPGGALNPAAQLAAGQNASAGSMPITMLSNAQSSSRAVSGSTFAPPMGAGPQAATAGPGTYDPELVRLALQQNGFGGGRTADSTSSADPSDETSARSSRPDQSRPTGGLLLTPGVPMAPGRAPAGGGGGGSSSGGTSSGGGSSSGGSIPGGGSAGGGNNAGGGSSAGAGGSSASGGTGDPSSVGGATNAGYYAGPQSADAGTIGSSGYNTSLAQATPTYSGSGSGASGYTVDSSELRRDSRQWADVSDLGAPIVDAILNSPDPRRMFGHMLAPAPAYREAVDSCVTFVEEASGRHGEISEQLAQTATNFDTQEQAAVSLSQRII